MAISFDGIGGSQSIAVIGLGYVGLPLSVALGRKNHTIGFDINRQRIAQLQDGVDVTREVNAEELAEAEHLEFTGDLIAIRECTVYIATVPTPVTSHKQPDLQPLISASSMIGEVLKRGDLVIFESTVYPGATEEICVPVLEEKSGLRINTDFSVGYSPERINPGDKSHRLENIRKVTAGSNDEAAQVVDDLYSGIITAGTHRASSIPVAEAAKVIENTQRDVNIALINELALIFNRLDIDTREVLDAAASKWNFLSFEPGLVGGHCIGVDPYYLTYKADEIGYHPRVILSGREINDGMGPYVGEQVIKLMTMKRIHVVGAKILVMGFTFKENCPDIRNSRVIDIVDTLNQYNANVEVCDPWIDIEQAKKEHRVNFVKYPPEDFYDAVVVAVSHKQFVEAGLESIRKFLKPLHVVYDVKGILPKGGVDGRL